MYNLRGGFLVRPLTITLILGAAGACLSWLEETIPSISDSIPRALFPSHSDPQVAQVILGNIATSIMTVVSIVFAILLMTLTLASMQFSPRIIVSFARDRVTQWTLGIFLGTFSYCMAALPTARSFPRPFAPVATVSGAMLLALACVAWLLFFIHHISQAISVSNIADRIASETEAMIDEMMPWPHSADGRYRRRARRFERLGFAVTQRHLGLYSIHRYGQARCFVEVLAREGTRRPPGGAIRAGWNAPFHGVQRRPVVTPEVRANCETPSTSAPRELCSRTSSSEFCRLSISRSRPFRRP